MTRYVANRRYTEILEYVSEEFTSSEVTVTVKAEDGTLFIWETCKRSRSYKTLKEVGSAKFSFTYRNTLCYDKLISHLKAV